MIKDLFGRNKIIFQERILNLLKNDLSEVNLLKNTERIIEIRLN